MIALPFDSLTNSRLAKAGVARSRRNLQRLSSGLALA